MKKDGATSVGHNIPKYVGIVIFTVIISVQFPMGAETLFVMPVMYITSLAQYATYSLTRARQHTYLAVFTVRFAAEAIEIEKF